MQESYTGTNFCRLDITSVTNLSDKIASEKKQAGSVTIRTLTCFLELCKHFYVKKVKSTKRIIE